MYMMVYYRQDYCCIPHTDDHLPQALFNTSLKTSGYLMSWHLLSIVYNDRDTKSTIITQNDMASLSRSR